MSERISSTRLRTHLDCARRAVFDFTDEGDDWAASEAMAIGTLAHAVVEHRIATGEDPTVDDIAGMVGNYDDPIDSLEAYPDALDAAFEATSEVTDPLAAVADALGAEGYDVPVEALRASGRVEVDLEDWDIRFANGWVAGGYIDLYVPDVLPGVDLVWDWKSRGRIDYAPRTSADFRADVQLCYYPAVVAKARPHVDAVIVAHGNLIRGSGKFIPYMARVDRWYLEACWNYFEAAADDIARYTEGGAASAPRNDRVCYKYGSPCPHISYCIGAGNTLSFRELVASSRNFEKYDE